MLSWDQIQEAREKPLRENQYAYVICGWMLDRLERGKSDYRFVASVREQIGKNFAKYPTEKQWAIIQQIYAKLCKSFGDQFSLFPSKPKQE